MGERSPDLRTVDDKIVTIVDRAGLQRGQVRTGIRLGITLAPEFLATENLGDVATFLILGAPMHQGWTEQRDPESTRGAGADALEFLVKNNVLQEGRTAAAVFLRPAD